MRLAIPILYSSFNSSDKSRTLTFLRTLLARPNLANYGRRLIGLAPACDVDVRHELNSHFGWPPGAVPRDTFKLSGVKAALCKVCDDDVLRKRWSESLSRSGCYDSGTWEALPGNWDSITALLLLLLPNISMLELPTAGEKVWGDKVI